MSMETAVVVDKRGEPLYWHLPPGRSAYRIPDSGRLWDVLWDNRHDLLGVAHSHPGGGWPSPSYEDLTTFEAVEAALGKRLVWWIITRDRCVAFWWVGPGPYRYAELESRESRRTGGWLGQLEELSYGELQNNNASPTHSRDYRRS